MPDQARRSSPGPQLLLGLCPALTSRGLSREFSSLWPLQQPLSLPENLSSRGFKSYSLVAPKRAWVESRKSIVGPKEVVLPFGRVNNLLPSFDVGFKKLYQRIAEERMCSLILAGLRQASSAEQTQYRSVEPGQESLEELDKDIEFLRPCLFCSRSQWESGTRSSGCQISEHCSHPHSHPFRKCPCPARKDNFDARVCHRDHASVKAASTELTTIPSSHKSKLRVIAGHRSQTRVQYTDHMAHPCIVNPAATQLRKRPKVETQNSPLRVCFRCMHAIHIKIRLSLAPLARSFSSGLLLQYHGKVSKLYLLLCLSVRTLPSC